MCKEITDLLFWTRGRLETILSFHLHHVVAFPSMAIWPRHRHSAGLCILGHMFYFVINSGKAITYLDYIDCMRRSPRKKYMWRKEVKYNGNYWDIVGKRAIVNSQESFLTIRKSKLKVRLMIFPNHICLILLWLLSNIRWSTVHCMYTNMY